VTTTRAKVPDIIESDELEKELVDLVTAENINVNGKEITTNGKTVTELEISVTNGQNLPQEVELQRILGRLLAKHVKLHLKDSTEFDNYKSVFVSKKTDGGVTKSNWVAFDFSSQEVTAPILYIGKKLTSKNGYPYGGFIFNKQDSEMIFELRDFIFHDTSAISVRLFKLEPGGQENIAESHVNVTPNANSLTHRMEVQQFYNAYGTGKFQFQVVSHDTIIAAKDFEAK